MKNWFLFPAFAAGALFCHSALAENSSAQLEITAEVKSGCTLDFENPTLNFVIAKGNFNGVERLSNFTFKCGKGKGAGFILLTEGEHSPNRKNRYMKKADSEARIGYEIYQGRTGRTLWDSLIYPYKVSDIDIVNGVPQPFRVFIPASSISANTETGRYIDTLTAVVLYDD